MDSTSATSVQHLSSADARHHRNLVRWWLACCLAFTVVIPIVAVMLGLHLHARDFRYLQDTTQGFNGRTILMEVVLRSADPKASVLTMDWTIVGEEKSQCSSGDLASCSDINVFFDTNLLQSSITGDKTRSSSRPTDPIFVHNATAFAIGDVLASTPTFRTDLSLFSPGGLESSLIYYPFDEYSAEICIFAQDAKDNSTIGIKFAQTRGIAVGFSTNVEPRAGAAIPPGVVDIVITLRRANLVRAFSVVTVLAVWFITLILLLVMITCVFFGFRQRSDILVIPVATLFAFTQLRGSMPGAPEGFGDILDFVGLLPCLALLSLSAAITLGAFILSDPTEKEQALTWGMIFEALPCLRQPHKDASFSEDKGSRKGSVCSEQVRGA